MEVLTISQAAELLQVHPETLTKMIDRNQIPAARINRRWRIVKADLMDWLRQQYNKGETTCPTRDRILASGGSLSVEYAKALGLPTTKTPPRSKHD